MQSKSMRYGKKNAMVMNMPYVNQTIVEDAMRNGIETEKKLNARMTPIPIRSPIRNQTSRRNAIINTSAKKIHAIIRNVMITQKLNV